MNHPFVRGLLGVTGGLILGVLCVVGFELISNVFLPLPEGLDIKNRVAMAEYVATVPIAALILVLSGYLVGTLAGSWTATKIGRSALPGYITGGLLLVAGVSNMVTNPHPSWFWIASIIIFIAMTIVGTRLARPAIASAPA
jgi:hypothetical protein